MEGDFKMDTKDINDIYEKMKNVFKEFLSNIKDSTRVFVRAAPLSSEDAIGRPAKNDYPLQRGVEKLMEADVLGSKGQAYTDQYGNFDGSLEDVLSLKIKDNYERAVFIATFNALLRHFKLVENTIHCKDEEMECCSIIIADKIKKKYDTARNIWLVGLQPRILESLSRNFTVRVTDRADKNIGKTILVEEKSISIENPQNGPDICKWADLILSTGSIFVNNTFCDILSCDKPILFYGTSTAGPAYVLGIPRCCPCSR